MKLNKNLVFLGLTIAMSWVPSAMAAEASLEDQLKSLDVPSNEVPVSASREKLYSVQSRFSPLSGRFEVSAGGGVNLTSDYLNNQEMDLNVRYYFSDKWFAQLAGTYEFNSLTAESERILASQGVLPDYAYVKSRLSAMAGYHLFYGKIRLSMENVLYLDQYLALGPSLIFLDTGNQPALTAEAGFVFWIGHNASVRVSLRDYYFHEIRQASAGNNNDLEGHFELGWVFGGGTI